MIPAALRLFLKPASLIFLAFLQLSSAQAHAADPSPALLADAIKAVASIDDAEDRTNFLLLIASLQAKTADFAGAKKTADSIADANRKGFGYAYIAIAHAKAGDMAAA